MDITNDKDYKTMSVIAGLQELVYRASKECPYYTDTDDPTIPETMAYNLDCRCGSLGMELPNYNKVKELTDNGLKIIKEWCK